MRRHKTRRSGEENGLYEERYLRHAHANRDLPPPTKKEGSAPNTILSSSNESKTTVGRKHDNYMF